MAPWLMVITGIAAYFNSFDVPFLFDDRPTIVDTMHLHGFRSVWQAIFAHAPGRPVVGLSLALNAAVGGSHVGGYHAFNLGIHLLAALVLFGVVRRTLLQRRHPVGPRASTASGLALVVALVWMVHPLQTESVTYIVQRAELLMGLSYLLTLYSVIRGAQSAHPWRWYATAICACAVGMASKPVMVTAPIVVGLYDRVFLATSWKQLMRQRRHVYLGLAATWIWLSALLMTAPVPAEPSAGFALRQITPLQYALAQPGVILYYIRLACWPQPLCFDYYGWPVAHTYAGILLPGLVVGALLWMTCWAWHRHPAFSFLGAWFFIILAPTSSVIPLADLAFEHRMYLPLASLVMLVVLGGHHLLRVIWRVRPQVVRWLCVGVVVAGGAMTMSRNTDYRSEIALWSDVVAKRPNNPRAHTNLGIGLAKQGQPQQATAHFIEALRLQPDYAEAHNNLGVILAAQGHFKEAIAHFQSVLRWQPHHAIAHQNLRRALEEQTQSSARD